MKAKVTTALVALALFGVGAGSTFFFQADAQTTFTAEDVSREVPSEEVPVLIETPTIQTKRYTENDITSQISSLDAQISLLQAERASWVALLGGVQEAVRVR